MEQLLTALLEAAKKDRKGLVYLKETAVRCQQFELASELRQLETTLYPETEYIKLEKDKEYVKEQKPFKTHFGLRMGHLPNDARIQNQRYSHQSQTYFPNLF